MFFTRFHKAILDEIWRIDKKTDKRDFSLYHFMEFYNRWHKKKLKTDLFYTGNSKPQEHVFSGYNLSKDDPFIIKRQFKRDVLLAFKELESTLNYLSANNLINVYERPKPGPNMLPECIPLYIADDNDKIEPLNDAYKIIRNYLGRNIQVRVGYRKFKRLWYYTDEELLRLLIGVLAPIVAALSATIVGLIMKP